MPAVLTKRFCLRNSDRSPGRGTPFFLHRQVFVDPVLAQEPVALAGMTGEHLSLGREYARDIDVKVAWNVFPITVAALDWMHEIQVRNLRQAQAQAPTAVSCSWGTTPQSRRL